MMSKEVQERREEQSNGRLQEDGQVKLWLLVELIVNWFSLIFLLQRHSDSTPLASSLSLLYVPGGQIEDRGSERLHSRTLLHCRSD